MADRRPATRSAPLPNPVMTASGCAAAGRSCTSSSTSPSSAPSSPSRSCSQPRSGRATPRMAETPAGMLNSIGLQGPGIDAFVEKDLPWLQSIGARGPSCRSPATRVEEYADARRAAAQRSLRRGRRRRGQHLLPQRREPRPGLRLRPAGVGARSCARCASSCPAAAGVRQAVARRHRHRRRSPEPCVDAGADGLTDDQHAARHGHRHRHDASRARPASPAACPGPAIRPVAVRALWQVTPRCARGGCPRCRSSASAACAPAATRSSSSLAGASAVQVGTAIFNDPSAPRRVLDELEAELAARTGFARFADAVGIAHDRTARPIEPSARRRPHRSATGCARAMDALGPLCPASTRTPPCSSRGACPTPSAGSRPSR